MVSGLNQQQNRNLQFTSQSGMQLQNAQNIQSNNQNAGQNFGALTSKPDTFEMNANDPNFGAIDRETIEKGAQEVQKRVEDNFIVQQLKTFFGIDIHNPKKTLISLGLTLATVIGLAKLGNSKLSTDKMADLGIDVSNALKNNNAYMSFTGKLKSIKDSVVNFLRKSKTLDDVFETFANRKAKAVNAWAKGTGSGLKRIFSLTAPDTIETALAKMDGDDAKKIASLKKIVGDKADDLFHALAGEGQEALNAQIKLNIPQKDSMDVSNLLLKSIGENFGVMKDGVVTDEKGLQTILRQLKAGKITGLDGKLNIDVSEFTNLTMNNSKGLLKIQGDWWPVNFVNNIGKKIRGDKWKEFGKGNLGDSLIKHSIISGQATSTKLGSFVQQSILFPTEAISNFVNDKSGLGFFLCGMIMNLYNNVQDAPNNKKAATMADDFMGTIGSLAITTPMAIATMYGLATLKNVEGKTLLSKFILKPIGKFFGAGLDQNWKKVLANPSGSKVKDFFRQIPGRTVGFAGGLMRLMLVMLVFQTFFGKPFKAAIHKVFGKPYDPDEEAALKKQQAMAAQQAEVMKNLNMTEEQMIAKLQAHPEFVTALQNDPKTLAAIQENPALLLQLIAALPDNKFSNSTTQQSSLLQKHIVNSQGTGNQTQTPQAAPSNIAQAPAQPAQNVQQPMTQPAHQVNQPAQAVQASQPSLNMQQNNPVSASAVQNNASNSAAPQNNEPVRTYIPSSKPFNYVEGDTNTIKPEEITNPNVQAMLSKADKAEAEAMRILG